MIGLYMTLGAIGGLVGVFVAGMVVALAQGLRSEGETLSDLQQVGVGIGIVAAGAGAGVGAAGVAHWIRWLWERRMSGRNLR